MWGDMNNSIKDWRGNIMGFRCSVCDEIKTKMWGTVCNSCRETRELIELLKKQQTQNSTPAKSVRFV